MYFRFIIYCLREKFNRLQYVSIEKLYYSLYNIIRSGNLIDGALAQLGECLHGMQEVVGSSPTCSIIREHLIPLGYQVFFFLTKFHPACLLTQI